MITAIRKLIRSLRRKGGAFMATDQAAYSTAPGVQITEWRSDAHDRLQNRINSFTAQMNTAVATEAKAPEDIRIEKKPVEIVAEITAPQPVISTNDLKRQIKIVQDRLTVLQRFKIQAGDEIMALRYLKARRYYDKHKGLFPWVLTTDALIAALVAKYRVQNVPFSLYSKTVPIEATAELEKFADAWERVVDDESWQPEVRLITDYKGPEHKKDPIMFASSPFGRWWYVLGAWDKEVEIVDDIVYRGK